MSDYCAPSLVLAKFYWEEYLLVKWSDGLAARLYMAVVNGTCINAPDQTTCRFEAMNCYPLLRPYIEPAFVADDSYKVSLALFSLSGNLGAHLPNP